MTTAAILTHHCQSDTAFRLSSSAASTTYAPANSRMAVVVIRRRCLLFPGVHFLHQGYLPLVYVADVTGAVEREANRRLFVATVGEVLNPIVDHADLGVQLFDPDGHRQLAGSYVAVIVDVDNILARYDA